MLFERQSKIDSFASSAPPAAGRVHPGVVFWLMGRIAAAVIMLVCLAVRPAAAYPYSAFYVFGDSLSDVGNIYTATGGTLPASPYIDGQFSNGPIWAQVLSNSLGLGTLQPSLTGGTDFAFGLATTGNPSTASAIVPTLTQQVGMFLTAVGGNAPFSALYAVWIGSNDLFNILSSGVPVPIALAEAQAAAQSEAGDIGRLIVQGARNILVPLVPDLGVTPAGAGAGAAATLLAQTYNASLVAAIGGLGPAPGLHITYLDTFSFIDAVVADPGAFGFTNAKDPCYIGPFTGGGSVCADPNLYLFWDTNHPTAAAHAEIAALASAALVPVPEPGALGLLVSGLGSLAFVLRRARRQCRIGEESSASG